MTRSISDLMVGALLDDLMEADAFGATTGESGGKPPGRYREWKAIIDNAVASNAPPSKALIVANERLVAWEAHLGIGKVSSFPVSVYFALTDICNARCPFCAYSPEGAASRRVSLEEIVRADWLKFSRLFVPNGNLSEPLAHPDIEAILHAVRKQAPFINISMTTNASLLSEKIVNVVAGYMKMMYVSLNAAKKSTYEAMMPPLKWEKVIGNLKNLKNLKDTKARLQTRLPEVIVSVVASRHNLEELPELPALLSELGVSTLRIHMLNVQGPIFDRTLMSAADTPQATPVLANTSFRSLERECERFGVRLTHTLPSFDEKQIPSFAASPYVFPIPPALPQAELQ